MSVRSGAWITSRLGPVGVPLDYFGLRRSFFNLPHSLLNFIAQTYAKFRINHRLYGLKPKHRYFDQLVFFTEYLPLKIMTGQVTIKGDIQCFTENGVIFKGEYNNVYDNSSNNFNFHFLTHFIKVKVK